MTITNKIAGAILSLIGIMGIISRALLMGYNNFWDFIMLAVFITVIILGISLFREK